MRRIVRRPLALGIVLTVAGTLVTAGLPGPAANAQPRPQRVVVVDTFNEVATNGEVDMLLPGALAAALREISGGRLEVVDARAVREEMTRRRWTTHNFFSLTNTVEFGRALGADIVVLGRVTYSDISASSEGTETGSDRPKGARGPLEVTVSAHVRAVEVATRRRLVDGEFSGAVFGVPKHQAVRQVLEVVARKAARAVLGS